MSGQGQGFATFIHKVNATGIEMEMLQYLVESSSQDFSEFLRSREKIADIQQYRQRPVACPQFRLVKVNRYVPFVDKHKRQSQFEH
jgi:hypothetical protein